LDVAGYQGTTHLVAATTGCGGERPGQGLAGLVGDSQRVENVAIGTARNPGEPEQSQRIVVITSKDVQKSLHGPLPCSGRPRLAGRLSSLQTTTRDPPPYSPRPHGDVPALDYGIVIGGAGVGLRWWLRFLLFAVWWIVFVLRWGVA